ncbi:hypothetical protein [Magnetococcus sp. PR-3]|uniref:hypothetical protein n=1 Tax=Magnetococcus sp. PR-3 TaxID=3120355 RepID=UPI002FCE44F5
MLSTTFRMGAACLCLVLLAGCSDSRPKQKNWEPFVESYLQKKQTLQDLPSDYFLRPERWDPLLEYLGWELDMDQEGVERELVFRDENFSMGPEIVLGDESHEEGGLLGSLKQKIQAGKEALGIVGEAMDENPELLDALRDGGVRDALKGMDRAYLEDKKRELMGLAESAGVDGSYQPSDMERKALQSVGKQFGVSEKRMQSLENQAEQYRDKLQ